MRIRRLNIQSFGALSGFHADLTGHNIVLIYGDNESGKSTVAEFMRSTMFPGKNSKYPLPKKSDNGTLEVIMDDGGTRVLMRDQKKVTERDGKLLPSVEIRLDAVTYRSLFGLDLEQLGNDKLITTGDLKKRFLTVPGGENVPYVSSMIKSNMDDLLTKERVTDTKIIGRFRKEVNNLDKEIEKKMKAVDEYNAMASRLEVLNQQLVHYHDAQDVSNYARNREVMVESLKGTISSIDELKNKRTALEYSEAFSEDDYVSYLNYVEKIKELDGRLAELGGKEEVDESAMSADRAGFIMSMEDEIENVWGLKTRLKILDSSLEDLERIGDDDRKFILKACSDLNITEDQVRMIESDPSVREILMNPRKKRAIPSGVMRLFSRGKRIIYTVLAAMGVGIGVIIDSPLLAVASMSAGIAVNVAPSVIDTYFHVDGINWVTWIPEKGFPVGTTKERAKSMLLEIDRIHDSMRRRDISESRIRSFKGESDAIKESMYMVIRELGIDTGNIFSDLNEMYGLYRSANMRVSSFSELGGLRSRRDRAVEEMEALLNKYGGEEAFLRMRTDRDRLRTLDIQIDALKRSVELATAGLDEDFEEPPSKTEEEMESEEQALKDKIDEINQEIGHIDAEMAAMRGDTSLDELKYLRSIQYERFVDSVKKWGVYSLADTMINVCCDHFYSRLQPTVVRTANRYLSLMTSGRYQIVADPRSSDLTIEDRIGRKSLPEWSAGLGDQVLLSIKMAIAKELTDETVPFIMDDVLVRFDRERKQGACRAIMEFAKDQQVIMFTCDPYLESVFRLEGDIKYLKM